MKCGLSFTILALLGLLASVAMEMDNNWSAAAFRCCRCWWPLCDGNRLVHTSSHRKSDRPCRNRRSNPTKTERWRCVMRSLVFIAPRSRLREAGRFVLYQGPLGGQLDKTKTRQWTRLSQGSPSCLFRRFSDAVATSRQGHRSQTVDSQSRAGGGTGAADGWPRIISPPPKFTGGR
jgi:hypothetical protein